MKHAIIAGLFCAASVPAAWAQSSVTLYGSLDAGVAYISNSGGSAKYVEEQGNTQPDRWGLRMNEDLGGGLRAVAQLENGFYTNTGGFAKANTIFNRQAFVGLSDNHYGQLTFGLQTPFAFDYLGPLSSAYQAASWYTFHPGNIDELADTGIVPYANSAKYVSPVIAGFKFGAMLGLGNTTDFSYGKSEGFMIGYSQGTFKAAATYSHEHNRSFSIATTGITSFQGQAAASYLASDVKNMGAGALYKLDKVTVHALWTHVSLNSNGFTDIYQSFDAGATYQWTPFTQISGGASTTTLSGRRWTQIEIGDNYSLSKSTQLYANVMYEHANSDAKAAFFTAGVSGSQNQTVFLAGIHHSF